MFIETNPRKKICLGREKRGEAANPQALVRMRRYYGHRNVWAMWGQIDRAKNLALHRCREVIF